jgi:acyl carrier protein
MNAAGSISQRMRELIARVCEVEPDAVTLHARLRGYGIDSIRILDLLMSVEEEFAIELDVEQMMHVSTVQELVDYIERQHAAKRRSTGVTAPTP